jgi:bifunctional DNase/RNase
LLDDEGVGLADTVRRHLGRIERDLERQERLRERLVQILAELDRRSEPAIDDFIVALEAMAMIETALYDVLVPVFGEGAGSESGRIPGEGQPVMLLKEVDGSRVLPIWIGHPEGSALALQLAGKTLPRPLTQDLMASLVAAAGAHVDRVSVGRFGENTFYAAVTVSAHGESEEVDARPSDALNLAVRVAAPVFVDAGVMEEWAVPSRDEVAARLTECGGPHRHRRPNREAPSGWRSLVSAVRAAPSQPA